ncbi:MAG: hypothetical protein KGQ61_08710 [Planctomycetes bacterium]|nr:hypothetical protein [Planctomycetota bacterium]
MSRFTPSVVVGRVLTGCGFLAVVAAVMAGSAALAGVSPVPEIDPMSLGSVVSVVVGALALREGVALKRRGRG